MTKLTKDYVLLNPVFHKYTNIGQLTFRIIQLSQGLSRSYTYEITVKYFLNEACTHQVIHEISFFHYLIFCFKTFIIYWFRSKFEYAILTYTSSIIMTWAFMTLILYIPTFSIFLNGVFVRSFAMFAELPTAGIAAAY